VTVRRPIGRTGLPAEIRESNLRCVQVVSPPKVNIVCAAGTRVGWDRRWRAMGVKGDPFSIGGPCRGKPSPYPETITAGSESLGMQICGSAPSIEIPGGRVMQYGKIMELEPCAFDIGASRVWFLSAAADSWATRNASRTVEGMVAALTSCRAACGAECPYDL
jgi:hypothetical protein